MRISDWSSDVCSSDLRDLRPVGGHVDKLVPAGDVAGRIDTGSGGPHPLVDPDSPVRRQSYAGLLQAQPSGVGLAADAQQQAFRVKGLVAILVLHGQGNTAVSHANLPIIPDLPDGDAVDRKSTSLNSSH